MEKLHIFSVILCIVILLLIMFYLIQKVNISTKENFDETTFIGKENANYIRKYLRNRQHPLKNPNGYNDTKLQSMILGLGETDQGVVACLQLQPTPCIDCLGNIFGIDNSSLENGLVIHYTFEKIDFNSNNNPIIKNTSTQTLEDNTGKLVSPKTYDANIIQAPNRPQNYNTVITRSSGNVIVNSSSLYLGGEIRTNFNENQEINSNGFSCNNAAYLKIPILPTFYNKDNNFLGMTFSFWFKSIFSGNFSRVFDFANNRDSDNLVVNNSEDTRKTLIFYNIVGNWTNDNGGYYMNNLDGSRLNVCDNVWRHIVWNNDSNGNVTFYVNNVPVSKSTGMPRNIVRLRNYIGKSNWNSEPDTNNPWNHGPYYSDDMFHGHIADFRVYERSLSKEEVEELYNMGDKTILSKPMTINYLALSTDTIDTGTSPSTVTIHGSVPIGLYKGRRAAYFNNSKQNFLSFHFNNSANNLFPNSNFSFGYWLYLLDGGYYTVAAIADINLTNPTFHCDMDGTQILGGVAVSQYEWNVTRLNGSFVGKWIHAAYTFTESYENRLYVNGKLVSMTNANRPLSRSLDQLVIGRSGDDSRAFHGYLHDVFYNNKTMTDFEIESVYKTSMENATNC